MATTSALPSAPSVSLTSEIVLQPPLSRRGRGPGLILIRPCSYSACQQLNESLDPEPLQKWAEESYAVAQITLGAESGHASTSTRELIQKTKDALTALPEIENKGQFALIVYGAKTEYSPQCQVTLGAVLSEEPGLTATICFDSWVLANGNPSLLHICGSQESQGHEHSSWSTYRYTNVHSPGFIIPGHSDFRMSTAGVAHTNSLAFIKKHLGGPYFDLEKIWDEHTYYEFGDRSVEKTMATMVQEPYVNHIPTLTGGIGRARLSHFYLHHFIFNNPDDTALELISRTIGTDRIVDEFIFCLTHVKMVDWLLPGVPPTGKPLRIPFTSVVNIRGDRLYHEHIAWDQATVLVQLGLLPEYLPFPYPLPDGTRPHPGNRFEYRVPAAGVESADKLQNEHQVASNAMLEYKIRQVVDQ
ncbi:hypothetical protein N7492_009649 [Penicillium capsulatum]|uniref:Carboxymethylenebutenolidase n=1 Tax=Penicillium capsulatum TaxID=69766 RepID=A0A9W9HVP6_9EURO|nr:hypothetical protein N7492_009649 [Penicillium capsulatum]KAJ6107035.1 hypothetical protein N7512_010552 [Penicillium capsulatum]